MALSSKEFTKAYQDYYHLIMRYAQLRVGSKEMAEDIAQEVMVRLWKNRWRYEERGYLRAMLYKMTHNLVVDELRKSRRVVELVDTVSVVSTVEDVLDMRAAIMMLSPLHKTLVVDRMFGYSDAEIKERRGVSAYSVKRGIEKARQKIREAVAI